MDPRATCDEKHPNLDKIFLKMQQNTAHILLEIEGPINM